MFHPLQPDEVARIDEALKADLQNEGFPVQASSAQTRSILVTLSENLNNFVWAAEVRQGDSSEVVFTMTPRPRRKCRCQSRDGASLVAAGAHGIGGPPRVPAEFCGLR